MIDNIHYVNFRIKNKIAYLGTVKFKTKDYKYLETLLIFTLIPLYAQEVWSLNQFPIENN